MFASTGKDVPSLVQYSVFAMVGGAVIAAVYDLAFDLYGYIMIFLNDLFTALNGIYMKKASVRSLTLNYTNLFLCKSLLRFHSSLDNAQRWEFCITTVFSVL